MEQNGRKATDVLLALESKIDLLLNHYRSQDLNLKILSNKINLLIEQLSKQPAVAESPKIRIEPADFVVPSAPSSKEVKVSSDFNLMVSNDHTVERRTSRESSSESSKHPLDRKKNVKPTSKSQEEIKEVDNFPQVKEEKFVPPKFSENTSVQVVQRVLNKNNSSVFLAEVEVKSSKDGNIVHKTRTNGIGKWVGTLTPGQYKVTVRKKGSGKEMLEVSQDINVDGIKSLIDLPDLHMK